MKLDLKIYNLWPRADEISGNDDMGNNTELVTNHWELPLDYSHLLFLLAVQ